MFALARAERLVPHISDKDDFRQEVLAGLSARPKRISPKYFYDAEGSRLFEKITQQAEYYPTRAELDILRTHSKAIASLIEPGSALVEFGSGSCLKVRLLLDAMPDLGAYVPVDISSDFLHQHAIALGTDYPRLAIHPVTADFTKGFALPSLVRKMPRTGFFPGSTIGNFEPREAAAFLAQARDILGPGAMLVIGVDLLKDVDVLHAAYNDKAGVTRQFNLNLLRRINQEIEGHFDLTAFEHLSFFNSERQRIEMHLVSLKRQRVCIGRHAVDFEAGEAIHTENSYKYSIASFAALTRKAGWQSRAVWTDDRNLFSVHVLCAN